MMPEVDIDAYTVYIGGLYARNLGQRSRACTGSKDGKCDTLTLALAYITSIRNLESSRQLFVRDSAQGE